MARPLRPARLAVAIAIAAAAMLPATPPAAATTAPTPGPTHKPAPEPAPVSIHTEDVDLFYALYDAADGKPSAEVLQHDYIDAGSDGVRQFVPHRILSGEALAARIAHDPAVYERARACLAVLPNVKRRLGAAFARLATIDPEARFPPVTILVGRDNSGGTTGASGVLIGLEVVCRANWMQADLSDRLLHLVAHEYGHIQQPDALNDEAAPTTVLRQSLIEGVAELMAELTSGDISNAHLRDWTRGRQDEIDRRFLAAADSADLSDWLYSGAGTPEKPGDLGYWEGYRIARAYYDHARDKPAALQALLKLDDPHAILETSGLKSHP